VAAVRHQFECPLRWGDMDAYGHVNNVSFAQYLEQARVDLMFDGRGGTRLFADGIVVADLAIRYRRPLVYRPEPVPIAIWVGDLSNASFTFEYEIADAGGPVYATARTVMVPFDLGGDRPRRLTAVERDALQRFRDEAA
jgi:acyl-CoA thioester hydrolase